MKSRYGISLIIMAAVMLGAPSVAGAASSSWLLARVCTPIFGGNCATPTPTASATPKPSTTPSPSPTAILPTPTPAVTATPTPRPTVVPGVLSSVSPQPSPSRPATATATPNPTPAPTPTPTPQVNPLSTLVLAFGSNEGYPTAALNAGVTRTLVVSGSGLVLLGLLVLLLPASWLARLGLGRLVRARDEAARRPANTSKGASL